MDSHKSQRPTVSDAALTTRQVSQLLNCSYMTAFRLVKSGELPAFKVRSEWRILASSLNAYVNAHQDRWSSQAS